MNTRVIAYLPLISYPNPASEGSVTRSVEMAGRLGADIEATAFNAVIRRVSTPLAGIILNIPEMIRSAEEQSQKNCQSLAAWARRDASRMGISIECSQHAVSPEGINDFVASQARYFDVSILGLDKDNSVMREVAEAVIFGSGRPCILVPDNGSIKAIDHIAVAWDGSRVAARALSDARMLIGNGTHITVITVVDEKPLDEKGFAKRLATSLERRGLATTTQTLRISGASIGFALQDAAMNAGAQLLVMGAYGHSRLRDFVLGGATRGVLNNLQLPVLLSH